jgi:5'-nucleotidase
MHILISNDDGYQAPGIRALADTLASIATVTVVAPDRDRSGASNSLTLDSPIRAREVEEGVTCVNGTPTDCVLYSGTVAAAMEGRFLGLPAIAVSLAADRPTHYNTAASVTLDLVKRLLSGTLPADTILNVNVPDVPLEELAGMQATRLGHRHKSEAVIRMEDPRGQPVYWVGPAGPEQDAGPGTDFHAVRSGYVSVTPVDVDLTRYAALESVSNWLEE